jgi:hypothetical protein
MLVDAETQAKVVVNKQAPSRPRRTVATRVGATRGSV